MNRVLEKMAELVCAVRELFDTYRKMRDACEALVECERQRVVIPPHHPYRKAVEKAQEAVDDLGGR